MPFNWKTPIGYLFAEFLVILAGLCIFLVVINYGCLFIGFWMLLILFADDISNSITAFNENKITQQSAPEEIKKRFKNISRLHVEVKQLSATN